MTALTPIIKQLLVEGFMNSSRSLAAFNPAGIGVMAFAALLAASGFGFLLFAGFLQLAKYYTNDLSALIIAGSCLVLAPVIAWIGKKIFKKQSIVSHRDSHPGDMAKTVTQLIDSIGEELEDPIRENPKTALMVASLAGFLAGGHGRH